MAVKQTILFLGEWMNELLTSLSCLNPGALQACLSIFLSMHGNCAVIKADRGWKARSCAKFARLAVIPGEKVLVFVWHVQVLAGTRARLLLLHSWGVLLPQVFCVDLMLFNLVFAQTDRDFFVNLLLSLHKEWLHFTAFVTHSSHISNKLEPVWNALLLEGCMVSLWLEHFVDRASQKLGLSGGHFMLVFLVSAPRHQTTLQGGVLGVSHMRHIVCIIFKHRVEVLIAGSW